MPKHTGKATGNESPAGYFFEEAQLRSLIDEKAFPGADLLGQQGNRPFRLVGSAARPHGSMRRMRILRGTYTTRRRPVPSHRSISTLIEKGTGEVKHDTGSLPVGPGSLVLIPAGEWHQLIASETGFDYIEFQAPFDFVTTMDHDPLGKNWVHQRD